MGVDGPRESFLLPFLFSASACSSKLTFRSRYAPHRFGIDCNGSSGLHRRWSRLAENVLSVHGLYPHPAAWLNLFPPARPDGRSGSTLGSVDAQHCRQWSPEGNARSIGAVCARRTNNLCTSSTSTDLLPLERCHPAPVEVTSPSVEFLFFFNEPCLIQVSPPHPALFCDRFRLTKVNSHVRLSFVFLCLETSNELCWCFIQGSVARVSRRSAIRHRVRPKLLSCCGHSRQQNPPAIQSDQETTASAPPPTASQRDAVLQLATLDSRLRRLDAAPILQSRDRVAKLRGRIWSLGGRPMHSLPTTLLRARAYSRVKPTSAATPTDQPHHPVPSRLVCRPGSSPHREGTSARVF